MARVLLRVPWMGARPQAIVDCKDAAARALVIEVLAELGIQVIDQRGPSIDLVLAMYGPGQSMLQLVLKSRSQTYPAPLIVLLPFWDERLARQAERLGAAGCHAMAAPLDELRVRVRAAVSRGPPARRAGGAGA